MNMPLFKIHVVILFAAVLIFESYSAQENPEENKEAKKLQCYNGTYTSENILKQGISQIFIDCPSGSSCFVSRTLGMKRFSIFTFGCGGQHPEIENGKCCQYFKKMPKVPIIYFFDDSDLCQYKN